MRFLFIILVFPQCLKAQAVFNFNEVLEQNRLLNFPLIDEKSSLTPSEAFSKIMDKWEVLKSRGKVDTTKSGFSGWYLIKMEGNDYAKHYFLSCFISWNNGILVYQINDTLLRNFKKIQDSIPKAPVVENSNTVTTDTVSKIIDSVFTISRNYRVDFDKSPSYLLIRIQYFGKFEFPFIQMRSLDSTPIRSRVLSKPTWNLRLLFISTLSLLFLFSTIGFYNKSRNNSNLLFCVFFILKILYQIVPIYGNENINPTILPGILLAEEVIFLLVVPRLFQIQFKRSSLVKWWFIIALIFLVYLGIIVYELIPLRTENFFILNVSNLIFKTIFLILFLRKKIVEAPFQIRYFKVHFLFLLSFTLLKGLVFYIIPSTWFKQFLFLYNIFEPLSWFLICVYQYRSRNRFLEEVKSSVPNNPQSSVSDNIIIALENERKRLAKDLHDEIGNDLAVLKLHMQELNMQDPDTIKAISIIDKTAQDLRYISHDMMPPEFSQTSFNSLVKSYFQQLNKQNKTSFEFSTSGINSRFSKSEELMIYRVIMELVNNVIKHADATEVNLQLIYYDNYLELLFEDNGKGFDLNQSEGFGIKSIQSRIEYLKGKLTIDSGASGTTTIIEIPYTGQHS